MVKQLFELFWIFFKIGLCTFGGGYVMCPVIQRKMVEEKEWLNEDDFLSLLAVSQSVPGALAINTAFQVGYRLFGVKGAFISLLGAALPSFLIIIVIAAYLIDYREHPLVETAFRGILPTIVALITSAVWKLGKGSITNIKGVCLFVLLLIGGYGLSLHPFIILLAGALGGIVLFGRFYDGGEAR